MTILGSQSTTEASAAGQVGSSGGQQGAGNMPCKSCWPRQPGSDKTLISNVQGGDKSDFLDCNPDLFC